MRIRLSLQPVHRRTAVPVNYQYPLSAAIYKILSQASPAYAEFLHDRGYPAPSGRLMKLFTFSHLWIPGSRFENGRLVSTRPGLWRLHIGSPMMQDFVQYFVMGLFQDTRIQIAAMGVCAQFVVQQVEALEIPQLSEAMRFKTLSPIVVSTAREYHGEVKKYYFRPYDEGLSEALRENLLQKYAIVEGRAPEDDRFEFLLESQDRPKSKKITLKEGTPEATEIKAFETSFTLKGNPKLMQVAWDCGLGDHNSQGFGMVEVAGG